MDPWIVLTAVLTAILVVLSLLALLPRPCPIEAALCRCNRSSMAHIRVTLGGTASSMVRQISLHPDGTRGPNSVHLRFPLIARRSAPGTTWCIPEALAVGAAPERQLVEVLQRGSWLQRAKPAYTWTKSTNKPQLP